MPKIDKSFIAPLRDLSRLLSKMKAKGVVIGGISVGLLGEPRFTADIDAVLLLDFDKIEEFIKSTANYGFMPRIKDAVSFAQRSHVILLVHKKSRIKIDLSIGLLPFEKETIERSKKFKVDGVTFHIPSPEDLIIMKAVAHRPKDLEDIRSIVVSQKKLDATRMKYWITEFAKVLEMPEIWDDVKKLLARRK